MMGGVFGASVAEVHAMINFDNACDAIFVAEDLSSFFDAVDWQALLVILQHLRPPPQLVPLLKAFYANSKRILSYEGCLDKTWRTALRGLIQGCPLSPMLAATILRCWSSLVSATGAALWTIEPCGPPRLRRGRQVATGQGYQRQV